jgi:hypothetical protein
LSIFTHRKGEMLPLSGLLVGNDVKKQPEQANQAQQKKEQLQKTVQKFPAIKNILHQPDLVKGAIALGTISPKLGADLLLSAKLLKPSGDTFKSISPDKGDVLAFNHNVVKGSEKIAKQAIKSALPQQQKDDAAKHVLKQEGGHDLFKDFGNSVFNGARSFTENAKKTGTALFNGASNFWMPPAAAAEGPSSQAQNNGGTGGASQTLDTKLVDGGINSVKGAQPLSAFANFRDGSISNRPFQLSPGLPGELDQNYRETRTPQQLEALNQQLDTRTPQEKLRDRFNQDATKTAQSILKANRDRLKTEQAKYTKDQNPNSAHWQQLWQMADRRREMSTAQITLKEQKAALDQERVQASPPPGLYDRDFRETAQASQKRIQSSAYYKRQVQIQSETKDLQSQIDSLEQDKATLEFAHPAVRAVQGETGKKPQDLQEVLKRIPGEFDGVRGNIDQLSGDLKNNPSAVINLDSVVSQQLSQLRKDKSVTPEQVNQLEKSIKDEKEGKKRNEMLTGLAGAGLTIGSFFVPGAGEVSMAVKAGQVMRVLGAGLSLYSASSALPDLMMLDKATQAQRGGAAKLTPQSEGEAKFNLYMGYTNLVLAGVDTGAHKLAINVAKSAGSKGLQALSQLDRVAMDRILLTAQSKATGQSPEWILAMRDLKRISGNDQSLYQRLVNAFKNANDKFPPGGSPQLATEGVGGNAGRITEELGKKTKNQPLRSQGSKTDANNPSKQITPHTSKKISTGEKYQSELSTHPELRKELDSIEKITDEAEKGKRLGEINKKLTNVRNSRTDLTQAEIEEIKKMSGGEKWLDNIAELKAKPNPENSNKVKALTKEGLIAIDLERSGEKVERISRRVYRKGSIKEKTEIDIETTQEIIQVKSGDYSKSKKLSDDDLKQMTETKRYRDQRANGKHEFFDEGTNAPLPAEHKEVVFHFTGPVSNELKIWLDKKGIIFRGGY